MSSSSIYDLYDADRASKYEKPDVESSHKQKIQKRKVDIRKLAQNIHSTKLFCSKWKDVCLKIKQLATVAWTEMEHPSENSTISNQHHHILHREQYCTTTLWDKQNCEITIRILLEEGKLNLLLRMLSNFKEAQRDYNTFHVAMESYSNRSKIRVPMVAKMCRTYEQCLGILMHFCLKHVESIQILDITRLIEHIKDVLSFEPTMVTKAPMGCRLFSNYEFNVSSKEVESKVNETVDHSSKSPKANSTSDIVRCCMFEENFLSVDKLQECLVIYYLHSVSSAFDKIDEEKIMNLMQTQNILQTSLVYIYLRNEMFSNQMICKYLIFLDHCFQSETYQTEPEIYLHETQAMQSLLKLYDLYLDVFIKEKIIQKWTVRALIREYRKCTKILAKQKATN